MPEYRSKEWLESLLGERPYIAYHPRWNALTGSPMASILLHQMLYYWWKFGRRPFWKFSAPCATARPGETWVEELDINVREFRRVRARIARKVSRGDSRAELLEEWLVLYWIDARRLTWYEVNEPLLARRLGEIDVASAGPERSSPDPAHTESDLRASPDLARAKSDLFVPTKSDPNVSTQSGPHASPGSGFTCSKKKNKPSDPKTIDISLSQKGEAGGAAPADAAAGEQVAGALPARLEPAPTRADERPPDTAAALLWETVLGELRLQVDGATFDRWLARSYALRLDQGVMRVGVNNAAAKEWLEHRLARLVERTLGYVAPDTRVEFVVEEP